MILGLPGNVFLCGEIYMLGGSEALLRAGGQQVCTVETGKKAACSADSVVAIRRGKFHQRFRQFIRLEMTSSTWEMGMAYPMPSTSVDETLAVLMPISSPSILSRAPPLLPGLMAASVWI